MGRQADGAGALSGRVRWLISGRVQGVGFRWFVREAAERLGLRGDVKNLADGRLEIRATGETLDLERLLAEVRRGPSRSSVDRVDRFELEEGLAFDAFRIRH